MSASREEEARRAAAEVPAEAERLRVAAERRAAVEARIADEEKTLGALRDLAGQLRVRAVSQAVLDVKLERLATAAGKLVEEREALRKLEG